MSFDPARPVILFSQGKDRLRYIARNLFPGAPMEEISLVGLSLRPAPKGDLDSAMDSAVRQGGRLKRAVLAGQHRWLWHRLKAAPPSTVICWNGIKGHRRLAMETAQTLGHQTLFLEEAPFPGRIAIDPSGVNAGNSLPRAPAPYLEWRAHHEGADWRGLRDTMAPRAAARRDVAQRQAGHDLSTTPYLFAPLQVPGDSQITVYGDWIRSVPQMIDAIARAAHALPEGWHLRVKEHPSAKTSFAAQLSELAGRRVVVDNTTNTYQQVAAARGVVTINSSVGLQAMLWDKPVLALGDAFWGWAPLAARARSQEELSAAFASPGWGVDAALRDAVLSYLLAAYFPNEDSLPPYADLAKQRI